jgi:hypothetical protein
MPSGLIGHAKQGLTTSCISVKARQAVASRLVNGCSLVMDFSYQES